MVYQYQMHGKNIALDVNSGSVYVLDDISRDLISNLSAPLLKICPESVAKVLKSKYQLSDILEAYEEIYLLYKNKVLFSDFLYKSSDLKKARFLKSMCLNIVDGCNMSCKYCFAGNNGYSTKIEFMNKNTAKKSVDFLIKNSGLTHNLEIDFFGGEPLMNFKIIEFTVDYAKKEGEKYGKNFSFTVTTNGLLLNDDNIKYINENMDNVILSLDGKKETNDNMRKCLYNESSYDLVLPKFIKLASLRKQENYFIRATFTRHNKNFLDDILHLLGQGFTKISVEPVVGVETEEYSIRQKDLPEILEEYEKLAKKYIEIKTKGEKFDFFHFMIDFDTGPCLPKRIAGCGVGREYVAVCPNGDIYPCHQFAGKEEFKLGNVDLGITSQNFKNVFEENNVFKKSKCMKCFAKFYCSGGCVANARIINGNFETPYSIGCEIMRKRVECAVYVKTVDKLSKSAS